MSEFWKPQSLFLRSEFIFWREQSQLEDVGDGVVILTPDNPYYRWGHVLVLKSAPKMEHAERYREIYEEKIRPHQVYANRILVWDEGQLDDAARDAYAADRLKFSSFDVLTLGSLHEPPHPNPAIEIRDLSSKDPDWQCVIDTNIESYATEAEIGPYTEYAIRRIAQHRSIVAKDLGHWYAAYIGGQFAGSLGFFAGDGLCRFQEVAVAKQYRKQGVGAALVHHAAKRGLEEHPGYPQIIVASRTGDAVRVYNSIGYTKHSESQALHEKD